mmetsp:Transcript_53471/g.143067  ORF Transcript_53471/g.143067 Transcript_53471/m.143067 type:complete len:337 (-) Transcript_53471:26-1036(-)
MADDPKLDYSLGETPSELPSVYGKSPRIFGLESCHRYRAEVPVAERKWAIAGMPNSGTNALWHLMLNCDTTGVWEVPWKKHAFFHMMTEAHKKRSLLPVVMVKDPLQWMASTCRATYFQVRLPPRATCPSPVNSTSGTYHVGSHSKFANLVELWSSWHLEYLRSSTPVLMIRNEDLLFSPQETVGLVCECLGGKVKPPKEFKVIESAPKWGPGHEKAGNRSQTLRRYAEARRSLEQRLTRDDRELLRRSVDTSLVDVLHYPVPTEDGQFLTPTSVGPKDPCPALAEADPGLTLADLSFNHKVAPEVFLVPWVILMLTLVYRLFLCRRHVIPRTPVQ